MQDELPSNRRVNAASLLAILGVAATWAGLRSIAGMEWEGVSALFTGLAFAGVIATMLLQREELRLQRAELQLTRQELRGQREQLEAQDRTLRNQTFEGTFFQLLGAFRELASNMNDARLGSGASFWLGFMNMMNQSEAYKDATDPLVRIQTYEQHFAESEDALDIYFANFQELLAFLERSEFADNVSYARLIRAQLFANEKLVIAHHALTDMGMELRPLIEKFHLLRLLPAQFWTYPPHELEKSYSASAFFE